MRPKPVSFEKFTDRARRIVRFASAEANRLDHTSADTVHLLLGMISESGGVAGHTLAQHGIDAEGIIQHYDSVSAEPDATYYAVEARSLLEAQWLGHHYVGTEHLLLAVCCLTDCRAARLLEITGRHPVQFCQSVVEILGHHEDWDRWLTEHPELARGS